MEEQLVCKSRLASVDLSAYQFCAVKISADNTVTFCNATTDVPYGILQDKPSVAGQAANVAVRGTTKAIAGAAITVGAQVMCTTAGVLITWTADAGVFSMGTAITGAAAAEDVFALDLDARFCKVS